MKAFKFGYTCIINETVKHFQAIEVCLYIYMYKGSDITVFAFVSRLTGDTFKEKYLPSASATSFH